MSDTKTFNALAPELIRNLVYNATISEAREMLEDQHGVQFSDDDALEVLLRAEYLAEEL